MISYKMTVKDGKFYKNNQQVPIEHGNKEQIELMQRVNEMVTEGFYPEVRIMQKVSLEFECVCGATNEFNSFTEVDIDDDAERMIRGETDNCHYCGLRYKVINDDDGLMLKIIPKVEPKKVERIV